MCKKWLILTLMISTCLISACGKQSYLNDRDMDIYEKIHRYYSEMESYSATLTLTAYSNKTENVYTAEQKTKGNRFYTKITRPGTDFSVTTVTDGDETRTFTEGSDYALTVPSAEHAGMMFVSRFFSAYYASEQTTLSVSSTLSDGARTVLETELSENNPRLSHARLTLDSQTLAPLVLEITDTAGKTVLQGAFSDFRYNDSIDDKIFSTEE